MSCSLRKVEHLTAWMPLGLECPQSRHKQNLQPLLLHCSTNVLLPAQAAHSLCQTTSGLFSSPGLCIFLFLVFQFGIISQKFREHYSTVYVTSPVLCAPWLFPLCHRLTAISMVWVERVLYKLATIFEIPLIEFHFLDNVTWFQETPIIFAIERVRHQFLITHCYLCLN